MTTSVEKLSSEVIRYKNDPAAIQRAVTNMLVEVSNGAIDIVDPSNPFVFCLESSAILTASFMSENEIQNRKQYPLSAQTAEDLYAHMSDKDFADIFALPTTGKFVFLIEKNELINKLVQDPDTGVRKIVIPRNTTITVSDTKFSLQYPVEIRQMTHGGIQIVYDATEASPLHILTSNLIDWIPISADDGTDYIGFQLEMHQFDIVTRTVPITKSSAFVLNVDITDYYYYTRVWINNGDGTYTEIKTTHTDDVYDPKTVTAVLKVTDKRVTVKIPQVYINTNLVSKTIRIDVYQTKGPINMNLGNYLNSQYQIDFLAINKTEENAFVAPLKSIRNIQATSNSIVQGGKAEMSFEELRQRVVKNAIGSPDLPITPVQIESALQRRGYKVVKNIDNITNRVFLATRGMPSPAESDLLTAANSGIATLSITAKKAITHGTIVDNQTTITITPDTIFKLTSGILDIVPQSEIDVVKSLPVDQQATLITNGNYLYTPFHYVMDFTNNEFDLRSYYLDDPQIVNRSFVSENDTTLLQVGTGSSSLTRTNNGYKLTIVTNSSDEYKALDDSEVFVQLAIIPKGESVRAYVNGVYLGKNSNNERIFEFDIITSLAIDSSDYIEILSLTMFNNDPKKLKIPLEGSYELLFSTSATVGSQWAISEIDYMLGKHNLPSDIKAISVEKTTLHLGDSLNHLWSRSRSVVSEQNYERYAVNIPATYDKDVYQLDPATGLAFTIVNGQLVYTKLHSAGDPVLSTEGQPVYKHRIGDVKLDAYGNPIIVAPRDLLRQMDLLLIEGAYYFATDSVTSDYRKSLVKTLVGWLTGDLPNMGDNLLEQTEMYFYPTTSIGSIKAVVNNGITVSLEAGQYFSVKLHVRRSVYNNAELRDAISKKTIEVINSILANTVVSISDIVDNLKQQYKDDVISISVKGLGGDKNYDVVSLIDDSTRLSLRKRLVSRNDESLSLEEDVSIEFVDHELKIA